MTNEKKRINEIFSSTKECGKFKRWLKRNIFLKDKFDYESETDLAAGKIAQYLIKEAKRRKDDE